MLVRLLWEEAQHHQHEDEREQQEGGHYQQLKRRNDLTTEMIGSFLFANSISSSGALYALELYILKAAQITHTMCHSSNNKQTSETMFN